MAEYYKPIMATDNYIYKIEDGLTIKLSSNEFAVIHGDSISSNNMYLPITEEEYLDRAQSTKVSMLKIVDKIIERTDTPAKAAGIEPNDDESIQCMFSNTSCVMISSTGLGFSVKIIKTDNSILNKLEEYELNDEFIEGVKEIISGIAS